MGVGAFPLSMEGREEDRMKQGERVKDRENQDELARRTKREREEKSTGYERKRRGWEERKQGREE